MHEKNLPRRAGLILEFEDGVTAFIEWANSQYAYMDGEKIKGPCRKCKNKVFKTPNEVNFDLYMKDFMPEYYNWTSHGEERVQEYFEAVTAPTSQEEQTPAAHAQEGTNTLLVDAAQMNWMQMMVFDAAAPGYYTYTTQSPIENVHELGVYVSDHVIPSHFNLKRLIDVYLVTLMEELHNLWHVGLLTHENAKNETFTMRAAFVPNEPRLHGMKSHDCHVFIQKFTPTAFHEMLPELVWSTLTENMPRRNDDLCVNDTRIQWSIFDYHGRASCASKKRSFRNELYEHHHLEDPNIKELVATQFKDWSKGRIVLFKCHWVDPMRGMKVHPRYHFIDVNFKKVYQKNEPFILTQQAVQVYYMEYPSMKKDKVDWMIVCKTKARRVIDDFRWTEVAFQKEETIPTLQVVRDNYIYDLHDPNGIQLYFMTCMTVRSERCESDDESDEDNFDKEYETEEDKNYD
ncbi:UNVERIFIED_CONTAM: hypothetical protein Sradi_4395400 [Sesamum radiatum]|uniref:DUF4216 domain-containing protein n=1 Tax=Sesamum radiatum TaxID=300843 RepID=A0AAW2NSZ6_SESRA